MNWIYYILEANLYLLAFYAFYRLFLMKETFYTLNRYYLISAMLMAFLLPLVQAGFLFDLLPTFWRHNQGHVLVLPPVDAAAPGYLSLSFIIPLTYFGIACLLSIRVLLNVIAVLLLAYNSNRNKYKQVEYFELRGGEIAFSFFKMLFLNPSAEEKDIIIRHEQVHMRQYHSLDTLFLEFIHVFSWFNPVLYLVKREMNALHEFIADDLTSSGSFVEKHDYAMLLIQNSFGLPVNALTKPIYNQSSLKKRITMLNQPKSASRARLRLLLVLPVTCAMICTSTLAFSNKHKLIDLYAGRQNGNLTVAQDTTRRVHPTRPVPPAPPAKPLRKHSAPPLAPPPPPKEPKVDRSSAVPPVLPAAPKKSKLPVPPPPPPVDPSK
jgi:hypothetical protein